VSTPPPWLPGLKRLVKTFPGSHATDLSKALKQRVEPAAVARCLHAQAQLGRVALKDGGWCLPESQ